MMDLSSTQAKIEDKLEKTINSDMALDKKTELVKSLLVELTQTEMAITKFSSMLVQNNNENINTEQNGH